MYNAYRKCNEAADPAWKLRLASILLDRHLGCHLPFCHDDAAIRAPLDRLDRQQRGSRRRFDGGVTGRNPWLHGVRLARSASRGAGTPVGVRAGAPAFNRVIVLLMKKRCRWALRSTCTSS